MVWGLEQVFCCRLVDLLAPPGVGRAQTTLGTLHYTPSPQPQPQPHQPILPMDQTLLFSAFCKNTPRTSSTRLSPHPAHIRPSPHEPHRNVRSPKPFQGARAPHPLSLSLCTKPKPASSRIRLSAPSPLFWFYPSDVHSFIRFFVARFVSFLALSERFHFWGKKALIASCTSIFERRLLLNHWPKSCFDPTSQV